MKEADRVNIDIGALIQEGLAHHQRGELAQAQACYEAALNHGGEIFDALFLFGVLSAQTQQFNQALDLLSRATKIHPDHAVCQFNRARVLQDLKRLAEALAAYDETIRVDPNYVQAYTDRGLVLQGLKRFDEALDSQEQAIRLAPEMASAHFNKGSVLQTLARHDEAIESYDHAIRHKPNYAAAHFNRGAALHELKRFEEALESYDQAIRIDQAYAEAYSNRGNTLTELKRLEEALISFDTAITIKPDYAEAYCNRGLTLHELKRLDDALMSFDRAISLRPDYAEPYTNKGNTLGELKRNEEARASYEKAIEIKPDYAEAYSNCGNALRALSRLEDAIASYDKAIAIMPDYAIAYSNRGIALQDLNRYDEAVLSLKEAIRIDPNFADGHWNLSLCHLLMGNLKEGWEAYESRWNRPQFTSPKWDLKQPLWLGSPSIQGKTILLHAEQGFGDAIQFARYVPLVAELGAKVIFQVQRPLIELFSGIEGAHQVIGWYDPLPEHDYQCPLMSLPLAFNTSLDTIPLPRISIRPTREKLEKWQTKLASKRTRPLRVGIVWSGSVGHRNDHNRSLTLAQFIAALPVGPDYISLQKEVRDIDVETLAQHQEIQHFGPEIEDFSDTAALCELTDLVISVDTSVAHLAGTLGKQTWLLVPAMPDWRWMRERSDSPWYPHHRLFRQTSAGDWTAAFEYMTSELNQMINDHQGV